MKLKKLVSVALAGAMALSLTACGGGETAATTAAAKEEAKATEAAKAETTGDLDKTIAHVVGQLGDKSFSDSAEAGMKVLREEGWDAKTIEVGDATKSDKWEDAILDVLDEGYHYVVGGSTFTDIMLKLSKEYPDNKFVIYDDSLDEELIPENVAYILYAQNEGSYMVGQMAAGLSQTGVIAVNVGMDNPVIEDFVTGFVQGAVDFNPEIKVIKGTVGSWTEPAKMKELCLSQARDKKADVFYQVAGGSGAGLFEACQEIEGAWAIGVDSDQYAYYKDSENPEIADVIVTSMLKEVGNSLISFFHSEEAGEAQWKKVTTLGLKEGAVGYVDNEFFQANVPAEVREKMAAAQAKVIAGEMTVKSYFDFADEAEYQAFLGAVAP
ncbi:MAG: BMP family ABC transporter substrate-binding protein [Lachnospiraceae bacterium]|nr:BMP family ABC transporter substrate-binding protein [Lachnospiraceae bacterium]